MAATASSSPLTRNHFYTVKAVQAPPKPSTVPKPRTQPQTSRRDSDSSSVKNAAERSLPAVICNLADNFINAYLEPPLLPWVDPKHVLAGNFAPVPEQPPTECRKICGTIPGCLEGVYIRNGPNPRHVPRGAHHLFDGDGMLHALRVNDGRVTFCSRFVRTKKLLQEEAAGGQLMPNIFSFQGAAGVAKFGVLAARTALGLFDPFGGAGLANTSVAFFNKRVLALAESDAPYVVRVTDDGDLQTVGRHDFGGSLFMGMTAHPKLDPQTGELFAFRYGPVPPFLNLFRVSPDGKKLPDVGILSMMQPSFIHDFAITERFAVFPDTQIVVNPLEMMFGSGSPIGHDAAKVARIGIIPRYATDDHGMRWFDVPGFNFIHAINAWDEGGEDVVVVAANTYPLEHAIQRTALVHCTVEKLRFSLGSGIVTRKPLSSLNLEFGVINPAYLGRKNRFAYAGIGAPMPKVSGVAKIDFEEERVVARRTFGDGVYGGEPFFVARSTAEDLAEDDGFLVTYTHNERSGVSEFVVMDAASGELEVVASVELPSRVPYGFHGLFVAERDLASQELGCGKAGANSVVF